MAEIVLSNVWKIYNEGKEKQEVQAVKNLNLKCRDGEFISFLGPSGCGKTSSLRMIAGLETISKGQISIDEKVVNGLHPSQRNIAMVFETYALYQHLSIYENIAFPLRIRGLPKQEIDQRINRAVEILDIGDLLNRMPSHLSDGQKQRVSIGRAIVRQPAAFLMDEPISHLDALLRSRMRREIKHLQGELGITTVYVTHDQLEATAMADRIAVMNLGEMQQVGTPKEIFEAPANVFVANFVGEPPMNFLEMCVESSLDGVELKMEGLSLRVESRLLIQALLALNKRKVLLGIRPMHIKVQHHQGAGMVPGQVYFIEPLDEFNVIAIQLGGSKILVETDSTFHPEIDDNIWIRFTEEKLHFFDPDTERNILHNNH